MYAIRYEMTPREIGDVLDNSRVWDDGEPTEEYLDGTCCLIEAQDKHSGRQYVAAGYAHKYLVEGRWIADGYDDGEVILENCTIVEAL